MDEIAKSTFCITNMYKTSNDMKDKIEQICYNLELGCIDWKEASEQLFALYGVVKSFVCNNCLSKNEKKLTDSTSQCKDCDSLQSN